MLKERNPIMAKQKKPAEDIPLDELFVSYRTRILNLPAGKAKSYVVGGSILSGVLIVASSLLYYFDLLGSWIPALIGSPAGVILFLLGLGVIYRTKVGTWGVWELRQNLSFKQRVRRILLVFGLYLLVFIPFGNFVPYGLGGAILITLCLSSLAFGRRTPEEMLLAQQGIPDPRDILEREPADEYAEEPDYTEPTPEADTINYDDDRRGGVGGKLN